MCACTYPQMMHIYVYGHIFFTAKTHNGKPEGIKTCENISNKCKDTGDAALQDYIKFRQNLPKDTQSSKQTSLTSTKTTNWISLLTIKLFHFLRYNTAKAASYSV